MKSENTLQERAVSLQKLQNSINTNDPEVQREIQGLQDSNEKYSQVAERVQSQWNYLRDEINVRMAVINADGVISLNEPRMIEELENMCVTEFNKLQTLMNELKAMGANTSALEAHMTLLYRHMRNLHEATEQIQQEAKKEQEAEINKKIETKNKEASKDGAEVINRAALAAGLLMAGLHISRAAKRRVVENVALTLDDPEMANLAREAGAGTVLTENTIKKELKLRNANALNMAV